MYRVPHQCWFTLAYYLFPGPNQSTTVYLVRGCEGGPWKAKEYTLDYNNNFIRNCFEIQFFFFLGREEA